MTDNSMLDKIYMQYKKLKEEATEDCRFDRGQIENSFDNTTKLMKWINKKSEWAKVFRSFEIERKETYRKTYEFYVKDFPMKLNGKDEYTLFIETDAAYIGIYTRCQVVKEIITYIDTTIETLKSRAWEIKAFLDYLKFSNGL